MSCISSFFGFSNDWKTLIESTKNNETEKVKELINSKPELIDQSYIIFASNLGNKKIIRCLADKLAQINNVDFKIQAIILIGKSEGYKQAAQYLMPSDIAHLREKIKTPLRGDPAHDRWSKYYSYPHSYGRSRSNNYNASWSIDTMSQRMSYEGLRNSSPCRLTTPDKAGFFFQISKFELKTLFNAIENQNSIEKITPKDIKYYARKLVLRGDLKQLKLLIKKHRWLLKPTTTCLLFRSCGRDRAGNLAHLAVVAGKLEILTWIVEENPALLRSNQGMPLIQLAMANLDLPILKFLVAEGAPLDAPGIKNLRLLDVSTKFSANNCLDLINKSLESLRYCQLSKRSTLQKMRQAIEEGLAQRALTEESKNHLDLVFNQDVRKTIEKFVQPTKKEDLPIPTRSYKTKDGPLFWMIFTLQAVLCLLFIAIISGIILCALFLSEAFSDLHKDSTRLYIHSK